MLERQRRDHDNPISSVWNYELPAGFSEPDDRPSYVPYEPTPIASLNSSAGGNVHHEIKPHQERVDRLIRPLIDTHAPDTVPGHVKEMAILDYDAGDVQRSIKGYFSYVEWKSKHPIISDDLENIEDKLLRGSHTPGEGLSFLRQTELESAELFKLSHPWGYRLQHLSPAREALREGIFQNGGVVYPDILTTYRKINLQPQFVHLDKRQFSRSMLAGFLVTYKHDIGHVTRDDGKRITIIERQSAALRIDENCSGIDQTIAAVLRQPVERLRHWGEWLEGIDDQVGYASYFNQAIQSNIDADFLVPLSTMAYAAVESDDEHNERRLAEAKQSPERKIRNLGSTGMRYLDRDSR